MAVKIVIAGCCGRMGKSIAALARQSAQLVGGIEAAGHPAIGQDLGEMLGGEPLGVKITDDAEAALRKADVLIEFTSPEATMAHLQAAFSMGKAMVIGTTGLSEANRQAIERASGDIPVVFSPNMSVGVNVLFEMAELAARRLGPSFDARISETHHVHKKDKPSGTAQRLYDLIAAVRSQWKLQTDVPESIREGEVVGDHTVTFSTPFERLELTHHAASRDVFAAGAVEAAKFLAGQPPGLYDMSHVLQAPARPRRAATKR